MRSVRLQGLRSAVVLAGSVLAAGGCASPGTGFAVLSFKDEPALLVAFTDFREWHPGETSGNRRVIESPELRTQGPWNELIVSWNVEPARGAGLMVEACVPGEGREATWYRLGAWSLGEGAPIARTSFRAESDAHGEVRTDTLVMSAPENRARLRLTLLGELASQPEHLRMVTVSFWSPEGATVPRPPRREAWGRTLDVPERSQVSYAGGRGWCSPTSISMVLAYWGRRLGRADLDHDVPEVAAEVYDPGWKGTGNWAFNTAYVGTLPGMRSCAARLRDLRDVEDLVSANIPVVLSVNAPALHGKDTTANEGHLVVAVGFNEEGDVVVNDPWARLETGQRVRRLYRRGDLERAWEHAHRLAYLVAPVESARLFPADWR